MNVELFLKTRPCLDGIDGYLDGLKWQIENPDKLGLPPEYPALTEEVLRPLETWRRLLLSGKEVPAREEPERTWVYRKGRKPEKARVR